MRIAIVHNEVVEGIRTDEQDVLIQADAVSKALNELGHETFLLSCTLDLAGVKARIESIKPDIVFNLVESLGGADRLVHLFPGLLDTMGIPYTGSSAGAIFMTTHKVFSKERMSLAALPTPPWLGPYPSDMGYLHNNTDSSSRKEDWIIKSLWDHGSLGLEERNVIHGKKKGDLKDILKERAADLGGACFAEAFIHGREFNISIIGNTYDPTVLPPAEIVFKNFEKGKPAIVGYKAKWDTQSHEYLNTPRSFDFKEGDQPLLFTLKSLALRCWNIFGLKGYARVDFRVDKSDRPWILEVNCNPCLNPDAGFAAASLRSGLTYTDIIDKIIGAVPEPSCQKTEISFSSDMKLRYEVIPSDAEGIRRLAESTGFFYPEEVDVAEELVLERLSRGKASGYFFVIAEQDDHIVGYACYGPAPCTASSFDFYWIAVHPDCQGKGMGKTLLKETERLIREAKGNRIYVETSQRPLYNSTRAFYEKNGYNAESLLENFYGPGDGKITYCKVLT